MPTVNRIPRKDYSAKAKGVKVYQQASWNGKHGIRTAHFSNPDNVLCYYCNLSGIATIGRTCDHYRPYRLFPELFDVPENLKTACESCDGKKRVWEKTILTPEQFEKEIDNFIRETFKCK
jgi:5-methylcytosine-specific restriction endonuclease McrA